MLMQRDGEHPGIVGEGVLHTVAVMNVDIDVGHPGHSTIEQPSEIASAQSL